jgi:molybdate transport system substrate-binding protein
LRGHARLGLALLLLALGRAPLAQGGEVQAAVAQNFAEPCRTLALAFQAASGHRVAVSGGSSGLLYAQIRSGAPFEVFLSADAQRPRLLEQAGQAVSGTRFTYALGRLVLFGSRADLVDDEGAVLARDGFRHLAIANPEVAPYGAAAREVLTRRGLWQRVEPKLVRGQDIAQTYQFVASGNAELGFVALSQLEPGAGSRWVVPPELYTALEQQAVLLLPGLQEEAAKAFLEFLRGPTGRALIEQAGYRAPPASP